MMEDIYTEIIICVRQFQLQRKKLGREPRCVKLSLSSDGFAKCLEREEHSGTASVSPAHNPKYVCGYPFEIDVNQSEDFKVITSDGY